MRPPGRSGRGPTLRLTYKVQGKSISEALPTSAAVRKVEHEIAEFRKYQELSRAFVQISEKIRRLPPLEETPPSEQEKKLRKRSAGKSREK